MSENRGYEEGRLSLINILFIVSILLLISSMSAIASPLIPSPSQNGENFYDGKILYVGGSGPGNYTSIQAAINEANNGDTVFVYNDSSPYYENVVVDKSIQLIGEERNTTIIDGMQKDDTLWVKTSFVTIDNLTVINCSIDAWSKNIHVHEKKWWYPDDPPKILSNIVISNCTLRDGNGGIRLEQLTNAEVSNCTIYHNYGLSFYILHATHVKIHHCHLYDNGKMLSPDMGYSGGIHVTNNDYGSCDDIEIAYCNISNNKIQAIRTSYTSHVNIHHNTIMGNTWDGISIGGNYFIFPRNCKTAIHIHNNLIADNGKEGGKRCGIELNFCWNAVTIENNTIRSNGNYGIRLVRSTDNTITRNNFIGNPEQAYFLFFSFRNFWDRNYWDDWDSTQGPWKTINGTILQFFIPWHNYDKHPVADAYII